MTNIDREYEKVLAFWQSKRIRSGAELDAALCSQSITFAYHSGRIENENVTYHDTREIFERDGVSAYSGDLRTLFEIRNAKEAYELMLDAFDAHRPLDENFVKELQQRLTQNTYDKRRWELGERPGEYKRHDYVTGIEETGVLPEDVGDEMAELLNELKELSAENALVGAAYFHARLENIHPFADGNGRTGRLAMNYLLISLDHPPVTIHEEDRKEYYTALEVWDREQRLDVLTAFLKAQTVKTWQKSLSRFSK